MQWQVIASRSVDGQPRTLLFGVTAPDLPAALQEVDKIIGNEPWTVFTHKIKPPEERNA